MALPNLAPPPVEETPDEAAQELERLRQEKAELEKRLAAEQSQATNTRLSELEQAMRDRYRQVRQTPQAPAPEPAYQAQQELGITDEEILANPRAAIERISEHIAGQRLSEMQSQVSEVLGHQVRRGFESEMSSLQSDPDFKYLAGALQEYFDANPREMIEAGAVRRRFYELAGANREYLARMRAEEEAQKRVTEQQLAEQPAAIARNRVVEPAIKTASVAPLEKPKSEAPELDRDPERAEAKRALIEEFNRYGANLSEDEWVGIESGKLLPKKVAADIQMGRSKPNVEY